MAAQRPHLRKLIGVLCLLLATGCAAPAWFGAGPNPHTIDVAQRQPLPQSQPGGSGFNSDQPQSLHPPRVLNPNDQVSQMVQAIGHTEDEKKALAGRLFLVERQLDDKERALAIATREIEESTAQLIQVRGELQQWKKDMQNLRDQLTKTDKVNRDTLEAAIKTLEQVLSAPEHTKIGDGPTPELLPQPKR